MMFPPHRGNVPFYTPKVRLGEIISSTNTSQVDPTNPMIKPYTKIPKRPTIYTPLTFWLEDPSVLFQSFDIIPHSDMSDVERLNAMTRMIIIITAAVVPLIASVA